MTDAFGEVLYDEDESLYLGASFEEGNNLDTEIHIIDGNKNLIEEKVDDDLSKAQKEAIYVAEKIKSLIDSKYQVYDNKKSIWRDIKESDIVILLRSLKNSEFYVKALNKRGISVYCASSSTYFDNYEIKLIINILKVIDNPVDDVALMSMISSPLFDISLDSVAQIKSKNSLYSDILNGNNEELKDILRKLDELKNYSHNKNIYEVLLKIYDIFNVYPIIRALSGGMQRQKNLVQMINHAFNFEKDDKKSFHEFISYIESITLNKDSLEGINPLSEGDNVLITTIHKSKGLEYPVVFVCETGKSFNFSDVRSSFMINDDLGICFPIRDSLYKIKYETCPIMLFREYEKSKMLSEELRVLYVALTRAKEKIIITGYAPNLERMVSNASAKMGSLDTISNLYLKSSKSYLDIILPCFLRHPSLKDLRDLSNTSVKTFLTESKVKLFVTSDSNINEGEFNEKTQIIKEEFDLRTLNKIKDFVYDDALINVPQSLSVSSFKQKEALIKRPKFMTDNVNHLKKGTLYHKILELLPIKKYTIESLEEELDKMVINNRITKTEKNMINKDKIFSYLKSSVYDIMLNANKVLKEYEMSFLVPANLYDKTLKKGDILVEGVVDLLIEKDGNYIIVDYKTDSVNSKEELKDRYKMQLDLYEVGIKQKMNAKNVEKYIYSIKLNKFIKV